MATLKGQNFRITIWDSTAENYKCIGMATNCTVNLIGNTEDSSIKDDVGLSPKPEVTSKSWNVQVESLSVADTAAMLTAIKSMTPFTLMWDETSTANNQTRSKASVARKGQAYLNDVTFNFDDRENSTKSLQFTGTSALTTVSASEASEVIALGTYTKGQFVRLFLGSDNTAVPTAVIAAAKQLSLHVSLTLEDASTKDTDGNWLIREPTALAYDISTTALMRSNETITSQVAGKTVADVVSIYESSTPVKWQIANVSGSNQRTKGSVIVSGSAIITSLTLNGPNRQTATYQASLNGYGEYTVSA